MTTPPAPGPDGRFGPPPTAPHYSVPAQQPPAPAGYVAPGMPGAPVPYGYAPLPPQPRRGPNAAAGIALAILLTGVGALAYGFLIRALEREISYAGIAVAALIALPLGKLGGRNPALPVVASVLSLVAVFIGQIFGASLLISKLTGTPLTAVYREFDILFEAWKVSLSGVDLVFYGVAAVAAFSVTLKLGRASS